MNHGPLGSGRPRKIGRGLAKNFVHRYDSESARENLTPEMEAPTLGACRSFTAGSVIGGSSPNKTVAIVRCFHRSDQCPAPIDIPGGLFAEVFNESQNPGMVQRSR